MKILVALAAILLVLGFNLKSLAEDHGTSHESAPADAASCSKDEGKECAEGEHATAAHDAHGTAETHEGRKPGYGANYDWSEKREEQVAAIFPTKQKKAGSNAVPAKVKLESPKFLAKVSGDAVTLQWAASEGATTYHIQVSKDAGFNNRSMYVVEDKKLAATTLEVKGLESGVKYFWRVAAVNSDQESMYIKSPFAFSEFEVK
ncbi:fibronectin type III domain-containing protein [Bdellovibrio sp. qaytius]|nr:fibronectin type III domain-containing protein [Bdellovibrio sp. qaytius]